MNRNQQDKVASAEVRFRNGTWTIFERATYRVFGPFDTRKAADKALAQARKEAGLC